MANADIGRCDCPSCGEDAAVRETKKGRAYIVCDWCGLQMFARGVQSDRLMRERIREAVAAKIEAGEVPMVGDVRKHKPKPEPESEKVAEPGPVEQAPAATRRVHSSNGETTVFDVLGNLLRGEK